MHRSPALRKIFKQGAALATVDDGSLRPAHLLVALIESGDPVVSAAVTKVGHDSFAVLLELRRKISRRKTQEKRKRDARGIAEEDEMRKKNSALGRFGRDLTAGGWTLVHLANEGRKIGSFARFFCIALAWWTGVSTLLIGASRVLGRLG